MNANLQVRQGESHLYVPKANVSQTDTSGECEHSSRESKEHGFLVRRGEVWSFCNPQMAHLMRVPPWRAWTEYSTASWHNGAFHHRGTATAKSTQMQTRSLLICPLSRSYHHRLQMCSCSHRLHMACFLSDLSLPMVDPSLRPSGRRARGVPTERSRP